MGVRHRLVHPAVAVDKFEASVCESYCEEITRSFGHGSPVDIDGTALHVHEFGGLVGIEVPSIHHIIVADAA